PITRSTTEYNSATAQSRPTGFTTYDNLTANNAAGVSLGATTTVGGTLALTAGNVTTGPNTLELAAGGSVARTAGQVVGNLQKVIGTGASSATFEIGSATAYAPVNVSFGTVTTSGTLTASTTSGDHPSIGASAISSGRSVNRYWTLGNGGTVFDQCSVVLTFVGADVDAGASTGNFMVQNYNAPESTTPTTGTRTATSIQATGLTTLGDF